MGANLAPPPHSFAEWLDVTTPPAPDLGIRLLREKDDTRALVMTALGHMIADHLVGADVLSRLGFDISAGIVRANIPTAKHIRSGDLGEILATEYVSWQTEFSIPLKKLRYKDDRDQPMAGNDVIGFQVTEAAIRVLKGEAKSAARLDDEVVTHACTALVKDDNRPKPSTLAFMSRILRREGRDAEAELIERVQRADIEFDRIVHLVFTLSGNDPEPVLRPHAGPRPPIDDRRLVGLRINDHQAFIDSVFQYVDAGNH